MSQPDGKQTMDVLYGLARHANAPIGRHFRVDSCIASTRIALDVLAYFNVTAVPMPMAILLFNEEAIQLLESGMTMDQVAEHLRSFSRAQEGTPWSIGLGYGGDPEPGKWAGHLVAAVPHVRLLLDLSIGQVSRPHKGMDFSKPMLWACTDEEWWAGHKHASVPMMFADDETGRRIMAIFDTEDREGELQKYKATNNWTRRPPGVYREITGEIIRLIKQDLEEA